MVYLLEDLPACYLGSSQKVSFFLDFLFVLLLLSQETPPIRGGLDNPACHTHTHTLPNTISLSSLLSSLLKIRKVYFSQNVVLRQMSLRASVCPAVRFFASSWTWNPDFCPRAFLETGGNVKRRRWHSFRTLWTRSIIIFHFLSRLADLEAQRRWWPVWHGEQGGSQRWSWWTWTTSWWTTIEDLRPTQTWEQGHQCGLLWGGEPPSCL